jgi:hypothetical protein
LRIFELDQYVSQALPSGIKVEERLTPSLTLTCRWAQPTIEKSFLELLG